jgi:hypothetical protein
MKREVKLNTVLSKKLTKKQLANLRREFAQLKSAGCISVLMTFEEFLKM